MAEEEAAAATKEDGNLFGRLWTYEDFCLLLPLPNTSFSLSQIKRSTHSPNGSHIIDLCVWKLVLLSVFVFCVGGGDDHLLEDLKC